MNAPNMARLAWMAMILTVTLLDAGCQSTHRYWYGNDQMCQSVAVEESSPCSGASFADTSAADSVPTDITSNTTGRVMTYQAEFDLTVANVRQTFDRLRVLATSLSGYMQELSEKAIVLRIPAPRLNDAMQQVEKLGDVTRRTVKGDDITSEVRDLDVRMRNLDEMRTRLYALLAKGTNVEELLLVEKELERVTVDIETIKARMLEIHTDVTCSTLTVNLNAAVPPPEVREVLPFEWVQRLGMEIPGRTSETFTPAQVSSTRLRLVLPPDYVTVAQGKETVRAMSGEGVVVRIGRHENFENGTLAFWSPVIRRWLTAARVLAIHAEKELAGTGGGRGKLYVADTTVGMRRYQYWVALYASDDHVYTYEAWGPAEAVERDANALEKSMRTLEARSSW